MTIRRPYVIDTDGAIKQLPAAASLTTYPPLVTSGAQLQRSSVLATHVAPLVDVNGQRTAAPSTDVVDFYPRTAAMMAEACGFGTWSAGWLFDESSGNAVPVFGSPTLTAVGSPGYAQAGALGDRAVTLPLVGDYFQGGVGDFNIALADDLVIMVVWRWPSIVPTTTSCLAGKGFGGNSRWVLYSPNTGTIAMAVVNAAATTQQSASATAATPGDWYATLGVVDRVAGQVRVSSQRLRDGQVITGAAVAISAEAFTNGLQFTVGIQSAAVGSPRNIAAVYMGVGVGAGTGMNVGIATAVDNFVRRLQTGTGYFPQSAAQMALAVGGGTWTAGWHCEEASGNLAPAFGTGTMIPSGGPTYAGVGPLGDRCVTTVAAVSNFAAGDSHDLGPTDDLIVAFVAKCNGTAGATQHMMSKATGAAHWRIYTLNTGQSINLGVGDNIVAQQSGAATFDTLTAGWFVGIAAFERGVNKIRMAVQPLNGGVAAVGNNTTTLAVGDCGNSANFTFGAGGNWSIAAAWVGVGLDTAKGVTSNIAAHLANLTTYLQRGTGFFPATAGKMAAAVGYGYYQSAWQCEETTGTLQPSIGAVTLGYVAPATYSEIGPFADKAVAFGALGTGRFLGTDTHDISATDDIIVAWVGRVSGSAGSTQHAIQKGASAAHWRVYADAAGTNWGFQVGDNVLTTTSATTGGSLILGQWYVGLAVLERSTLRLRLAVQSLETGLQTISSNIVSPAFGDCGNVSSVGFGTGSQSMWSIAGAWISTGPNAAQDMTTNIATALSNLVTHLKTGATPAISQWLLTKTAILGWSNSGAASAQMMVGDCQATYVVTAATHRSIFGFSTTDLNTNYTSQTYGLVQTELGGLEVWELGVQKYTGTAYAAADVLTITRVGTTVTFAKNGVVFYTSLTASSGAVLLDVALNTLVAEVGSIKLYDNGTRIPITWKNVVGLTTAAS